MISNRQRKALELFFKVISEQFKNAGQTFNYTVLSIEFQLPFTPIIVREQIWKPIQKALFDIDTTKDLDTDKINQIIDVFTLHFAKSGLNIEFPSLQSLLNRIDLEEIRLVET